MSSGREGLCHLSAGMMNGGSEKEGESLGDGDVTQAEDGGDLDNNFEVMLLM